jgi:hypothetical protein
MGVAASRRQSSSPLAAARAQPGEVVPAAAGITPRDLAEGNTPPARRSCRGPGGGAPRLVDQVKNKGVTEGPEPVGERRPLSALNPNEAYVPPSVEACARGAWALGLWAKPFGQEGAGPISYVRWRCLTRRHEGICRKRYNRLLRDRIVRGLTKYRPEDCIFVVLTLMGRHGSKFEAFRTINRKWKVLRHRLERRFGKLAYCAVAEVHRDGFPHLNLLVVNESWATDLRIDEWQRGARVCAEERSPDWFQGFCVDAGFGMMATCERAQDVNAVAGYIGKLASDVGVATPGTVAEVAKLSQVPEFAPPHFRSLWASRGFLGPKIKNEAVTGEMHFATEEECRNFASEIHKWRAWDSLWNYLEGIRAHRKLTPGEHENRLAEQIAPDVRSPVVVWKQPQSDLALTPGRRVADVSPPFPAEKEKPP